MSRLPEVHLPAVQRCLGDWVAWVTLPGQDAVRVRRRSRGFLCDACGEARTPCPHAVAGDAGVRLALLMHDTPVHVTIRNTTTEKEN